jgi:HK97 family phage portal protein
MAFLEAVRRGMMIRAGQYIGARHRGSGFLRSGGTGFDWVSSVGDLQSNSTVAIGLQTIIDKIDQSSPMVVKNVKGQEDAQLDEPQHQAFMSLITSPDYTPKQFFKVLAASCKLYGPAYVVVERSGTRGAIEQLVPFPANQVRLRPDGSYDVHRHGDRAIMQVPAADMIPIMYGLPSPTDSLITIAPLQSLLRQISADNSAATFMASIFNNMGLLSLIVNPKNETKEARLTKGQRDRIHDSLTTFTGDRSGGIYVPPEPVDVHKVSMSPDEMKTTDTKRITITEILGALGVDPMVCSLPSENRTFTNYAEARQSLIEDTVLPLWKVMLDPILEYLNRQRYFRGDVKLVPDKGQYPELKKGDKEKADSESLLFRANITTRAQALKRLGIEDKSTDQRLFSEILLTGKAAGTSQLSARAKAAIERLRAIHDAAE